MSAESVFSPESFGVDDESWIDEETAVDLEVDDELSFENDESPLRLPEGEDDRFAFGIHDTGSYAAEELAVHPI
jgi:hypothetical protein